MTDIFVYDVAYPRAEAEKMGELVPLLKGRRSNSKPKYPLEFVLPTQERCMKEQVRVCELTCDDSSHVPLESGGTKT
jgi:hypothetical protein